MDVKHRNVTPTLAAEPQLSTDYQAASGQLSQFIHTITLSIVFTLMDFIRVQSGAGGKLQPATNLWCKSMRSQSSTPCKLPISTALGVSFTNHFLW